MPRMRHAWMYAELTAARLNLHARVYTRSADEEERRLATRLEAAAVAAAAEVVTLSRADAKFVAEELATSERPVVPKVIAQDVLDRPVGSLSLRATSGTRRQLAHAVIHSMSYGRIVARRSCFPR